ncbi:10928_t:CDS:2 [Ambispora gerdemannii]|uniref:10928_t:CDS:1 n=1 Tax=Ambispora gerdemannii TaxID=144530 RepID=A0A9N9AAV9_9GLOM|nr:10928_t:CDS:2 [Ambispora gerdemannii]
MSLFPPVLEAISTRFRQRQARVYLYNVTRPLSLSGRASEIKKVRICIFPNAFVNVEIFNAHSTCPYSLTQNFGVKCLAYFSYLFPQHELRVREDMNGEVIRDLKRQRNSNTIFFVIMSSSTLYENIYNFLLDSPSDHITAFSVIFQLIDDDTWYSKDKLREIIHQAIIVVKKNYDQTSEKYLKLVDIPLKFDDAYEGVSSLRSIKESKQEEPLTKNEIETNLRVLKTNLKNSKAPYAHHFRKYLKKKSASDLSWRVPLASQVICADSEMVRTLEVDAYNFFMDPAERMKVTAPDLVKNNCDSFVLNFIDSITDVPNNRLLHDKSWKESNEKLAKVTLGILDIL